MEVEKIIKERSNVEEFELYEIEINSNLDIPEKQIIEDILKKINTIGFENSALNFSTSTTSSQKGYLGWINGKTLSKEIYLILSKMKIGEVSKPIKKQNNILFLKLNNKRTIKPENSLGPGRNVIVWDGKDFDGSIVPSGLYIVTLESSESILRTTVGVLNR